MENKIEARHLNLYYGQKHALKDVSLDIKENKITAFIGPSGCGKSTFLKTLNRMNDYVDNVKIDIGNGFGCWKTIPTFFLSKVVSTRLS